MFISQVRALLLLFHSFMPVRGISSAMPLPLGSLSRKALSTSVSSSIVVGAVRPSASRKSWFM